jgi:hypothetical protein
MKSNADANWTSKNAARRAERSLPNMWGSNIRPSPIGSKSGSYDRFASLRAQEGKPLTLAGCFAHVSRREFFSFDPHPTTLANFA